ncbi:putative lipid II flippase FtsW [Psychrobacter lutiphocae]|uniref:putative lipid II flippase FtsW n=1 Tax=Psychrobacter lutiphocae TaxID=540500 RepID=UPI00037AA19F|nr:putative lipid II flippase FtsW [Psychrobacter lutiphocae]
MAKDTSKASAFATNTATSRKRDYFSMFSVPTAGGVLITSVSCLLVLSLIMVASASIPFANMHDLPQLTYFKNQFLYMIIGLAVGFIVYKTPLSWFYDMLFLVLSLAAVLLLLILTLAIGNEINGAKRWIQLGPFNFQVAELAKLVMVLFTADFVVRRANEVRQGIGGIIRLGITVGVLIWLIMSQPDFGSAVILSGVILSIFFVAGASWAQISILVVLGAIGGVYAILFQEYRLIRFASFWDPFDDIQGSDYQLARSLIAFGRGEVTGVGYGESVQKLAHLPEAHTDFLLAITGEELGLVGVLTVLFLEAVVVICTMRISYNALRNNQMRLSYTAFGIGVIFIGQIVINAGMNMGVMPTKGLTLPFFSYGGSSMLMCLIMVGLLLNIQKTSPKIAPIRCRHY